MRWRTRSRGSIWWTDLIQESDKDKILGHFADARAKIAEAYSIDPASPVVAQHMDELASATVAGEPAVRSEAIAGAPPIAFEPKADCAAFIFTEAMRNVISQVLPAYGIQPTIDDSVGSETIRYDVDEADFVTAERTLMLATGTFFVPLDPARALVAKDTRANHDKYERETVGDSVSARHGSGPDHGDHEHRKECVHAANRERRRGPDRADSTRADRRSECIEQNADDPAGRPRANCSSMCACMRSTGRRR